MNKDELTLVVDWLNKNYNQDSENYNVFFGSKPGVVKYNDHIAISLWGCGAVVCIYDMLYFVEEDDGSWWIKEEEDKKYGEYGYQGSFSIAWAEGFAEAVKRLKEYVYANGKPVYYSGTDVVCHYRLE